MAEFSFRLSCLELYKNPDADATVPEPGYRRD